MTKHFTADDDDAIGNMTSIATQWPLIKVQYRCQGLYQNPIGISTDVKLKMFIKQIGKLE